MNCPTCGHKLVRMPTKPPANVRLVLKYEDEEKAYWCDKCKVIIFEEDLYFNLEEE